MGLASSEGLGVTRRLGALADWFFTWVEILARTSVFHFRYDTIRHKRRGHNCHAAPIRKAAEIAEDGATNGCHYKPNSEMPWRQPPSSSAF